jgi:hypothetical protein
VFTPVFVKAGANNRAGYAMAEGWLKLSISLCQNPKVMHLTSDLFKVWVCLLVEAKRLNEDGLLPPIGRLAFTLHTTEDKMQRAVEALTEARLVDRAERGLVVHDWSEWQAGPPSAHRDAVRERVARYRETRRNELHGVTKDVTSVTTPEETRSEEKREDEKRGEGKAARGARIPPEFSLSIEMNEYAAHKGVSFTAASEHAEEFRLYWSQATKNATSRDWEARWKTTLARDIRDGRVKPDMSPATDEDEDQSAVRTPAEESFVEAVQHVAGVRSVVSPLTETIVEAAGGWDVVGGEAFDFKDWLPLWHQVGGARG